MVWFLSGSNWTALGLGMEVEQPIDQFATKDWSSIFFSKGNLG